MHGSQLSSMVIDIDELSGVFNRHYLRDTLTRRTQEYIYKQNPFTIAMVDIDYFKNVNDSHGHSKGDEVIRSFSQFLVRSLRARDQVVRYGGDEFLCFLPDTGSHDAESLFQRILRNCTHEQMGGLMLTFSAGLASFPEHGSEFSDLLEVADQALYDAKRRGRACIGRAGQKRLEIPIRDFIDRLSEQERLRTFLLESGEKRIMAVIRGHVGVGKTRLVKETLAQIQHQEILWANCISFSEDLGYYPLRELVKYKLQRQGLSILEGIPEAYLAELGKLVPEIAQELGERLAKIDPMMDRYRLYEGIRRLLEVGDYPQVMVIDNVQWMDRESPEVLKYLFRTISGRSTCFLLIYREEEQTEQVAEFLEYLSREIEILDLQVNPFDLVTLKTAVHSILGEEGSDALLDYLWKHTGGVPYFLEEIVRLLFDGGYLELEGTHWSFTLPPDELVPQKAREVTLRKYRSLNQEAQKVVQIASAIGDFDIPLLIDLTGFNEGHLIGCIDTIARQGFTRELRGHLYFAEELSHQAIYQQTIVGLSGQDLHRRIGEFLEVRYRGREQEGLDELAFHFCRSQDRQKGANYAIRAGDLACSIYANREALQHFQRAMELLGNGSSNDRKQWVDCLIKRVEVLLLLGRYEDVDHEVTEGLRKARMEGADEQVARLLHQQASAMLYRSQFRPAMESAQQAAEYSLACGHRGGAAQALTIVVLANYHLGELTTALQVSEKALELARSSSDHQAETRVLNARGLLYALQGKRAQAIDDYHEALEIDRRIGDRREMAWPTTNIGNLYSDMGQYDQACVYYQAALTIQRAIGYAQGMAISLNNLGKTYVRQENSELASPYLEEALRLSEDLDDDGLRENILENLGLSHQRGGRLSQAQEYFQQALTIARKIGDRISEAHFIADLAALRVLQEKPAEALALYQQARALYDEIPPIAAKIDNLLALSHLFLVSGQAEQARESLDLAQQAAEEIEDPSVQLRIATAWCDYYQNHGDETACLAAREKLKTLQAQSFSSS